MAVIADKCKDLNVIVVDMNQKRIDAWNSDDLTNLPIFEPGLSQVIKDVENLHFVVMLKNISDADMIFISVNTPTKTRGLGAGQTSDLSGSILCSPDSKVCKWTYYSS